MITKPRARRVDQVIVGHEVECHHWLGRLSMCLATTSHDLPAHLKSHVRKTLDEFVASGAASDTLARFVKDEVAGVRR